MEFYKDFLKESMRVLKSGGKLYIDNVYFGDPIPGDDVSEISTIKQARDIFDSLGLNAEVFLSTEGAVEEGGKAFPDKRVCAIVTK